MAMDDPHHDHHSFLTKGCQVEVSSDEDGTNGAWYVATVILPPPTTNNLVYLEYHNLFSDDASSTRLREYADVSFVRPAPVPDPTPATFQLNDVVDAFYRDGWWTGVVTCVLDDSNFVVTLRNPPEEIKFCSLNLRTHKKWVGGRWIPQNQGDTAVRTTRSLIDNQFEQATPNNDTTSPNNDTRNEDSVVIEKHASVAQREGVDFEGGGTTDQAFSKIENLSHGKKVHSKRERSVELKTPAADSSIKKGKFTNEPKSLQAFTNGSEDNSFRTRTQMGKQNATRDLPFVILGVQCHRMTVSPSERKMVQNLSREKNPDVAKSDIEAVQYNVFGLTASSGTKSLEENPGPVNEQPELVGKQKDVQLKNEKLPNENTEQDLHVQQTQQKQKYSARKRKPVKRRIISINSESPAPVDYEIGSNVSNTLSGVGAGQSKEGGLTTSSGTISLEEYQGPVIEQSELAGKQNVQSNKDKPPNENTGQDLHVQPTELKKKYSSRKRKPVKRRTVGIITESPAPVHHETGSNVSHSLYGVVAGQSKEVSLTTSSETKSLEGKQGPAIEHPGLAGKQNIELNNDKPSNENTGQDLHDQPTQQKNKHSAINRKLEKQPMISINAESLAQDSHDACKETVDASLDKDLPTEASVGKSGVTMPDDQLISRAFEGKHSSIDGPDSQAASKETADGSLDNERLTESAVGKSVDTTMHDDQLISLFEGKHSSTEGAVEQSSEASVGWFDSGNLPFIKSTALWKTLVSMEAFRMLPQKPHFRPLLEGVREGAQEGLAIGNMVTFSTMFDQTCSLKVHDPRCTIKDCLETLEEFENNGFDVEVIRERLTGLLLIKDKQEEINEQTKGVVGKIQENKMKGKKIEEEIEELKRQMWELEERKKQALVKKEKRVSEMGVRKAVIERIKQEIREASAEFDRLAAAPFVE